MMKSALLTVLLLGISLAVSADASEQQAMLRAFELSCKDCNTLQYGSADPLTEHTCPTGTLCGPVGEGYSCIPEDSAEAASCSCGGQENSYIAEPYDPAKYIVCLPDGEQSVITCTEGVFTGDTVVPCGTGPECADPAVAGFNALVSETESCRKYFFCDAIPATDTDAIVPTYECPEGQVFDTTMLGCVDPCTLAPEPFVCEADFSGPYADPEDCTVFHICFNGVKIGDPIACPEGNFFDDTKGDCSGTADTVCKQEPDECYLFYQDQC